MSEIEVKAKGMMPLGDSARHDRFWDRVWMCIICGGLYVLLYREELIRLFDRWMSPKESHGLMIPLFSLWFIYQERKRLAEMVGKPSYLGLLAIILSIGGYLFSSFKGFAYPKQIMMLGTIGGIVLMLGGWRILYRVLLPIVFLFFAMPLPARLYNRISQPLREMASTVASTILDLLPNIDSQAVGVLIHGTHGPNEFSLNVAEACSGMRLLLAFVALGVAMAYMEKRPLIHRIVLFCSTVPIAVFCNMVRVLLTGLIHIYVGPEYAQGTLHTILGMVMLILAFSLYGLLAWLMNNLFEEEREDEGGDDGVLIVGGSKS